MEKEMSPQQRHALTQVNGYQQQIQILISQRQQMELQLREIDLSYEELKKESATEVYKAIGPALIKKDKKNVLDDLKEARDKVELRIKTIKSQEKRLSSKIKELSSKLR